MEKYIPRLKKLYKERIVPTMVKEFGYKGVMQVPIIEKIVVNSGVSLAKEDIKYLNEAVDELSRITGQRPIITKAKKSISNFKLRKGMSIGCKVTLRGNRMYEFLDRLINVALPRVRDFKGISLNAFDKDFNYNLGIEENVVFAEVDLNKVSKVKGLSISIKLNKVSSKEEAIRLLSYFGMPFRKK